MINVVGVRFKTASKIYYFDPGKKYIKLNDNVIVETVRGVEFGEIVVGPKDVPDEEIVTSLKPVLRVATNEDKRINEENKQMEKEAFDICMEKIKLHELVMKLIDVEYTFDRNKIIFYFTADGRVDFRELVKDLAAVFKTRIELRQIGVRDEAKMLGGLGPCGRPLCCKQFLNEFCPVSIKMAKEQNLSLNPTKISGICSRLMCCLNYEHEGYEENLKLLPNAGAKVVDKYSDRQGVVLSINVLALKVRVKFFSKDGGDEIVDVSYDDLIYINNKPNKEYEQKLKNGSKNLENVGNKETVKNNDDKNEDEKFINEANKNQKSRPNRPNKSNKPNRDNRIKKQNKVINQDKEAEISSDEEKTSKVKKLFKTNKSNKDNKQKKDLKNDKQNKSNKNVKEEKSKDSKINSDKKKNRKKNLNNVAKNEKLDRNNFEDKDKKDNRANKNLRNSKNSKNFKSKKSNNENSKNMKSSIDNLSIEKRIEMELVKRRDDKKKADKQKNHNTKIKNIRDNNILVASSDQENSVCGCGNGNDSGCSCGNGNDSGCSGCGNQA